MKKTLFLIASISLTFSMHGQMAPQETEWYTPTPPKIVPGTQPGAAPSDAIILFDGKLESPAYITVVMNGILVQNNFELKGNTPFIGYPTYTPHGRLPLMLQDHGTEVAFRNIWIREL